MGNRYPDTDRLPVVCLNALLFLAALACAFAAFLWALLLARTPRQRHDRRRRMRRERPDGKRKRDKKKPRK